MPLTQEQIKDAIKIKDQITSLTKIILKEYQKGEEMGTWTYFSMNYTTIKESLLELINKLSTISMYSDNKKSIKAIIDMVELSLGNLNLKQPDISAIALLPIICMSANRISIDINKKRLSIDGEIIGKVKFIEGKIHGKFE